jgi:hypothetical protein
VSMLTSIKNLQLETRTAAGPYANAINKGVLITQNMITINIPNRTRNIQRFVFIE